MIRGGALLLSMAMLGSAQAADLNRIKNTLQAHFPEIKIDQVQAAAWPGMFEIVTPIEIAYTNAAGSLLFVGQVLDTKTHEDLTQQRWNQISAIDFSTLPLDLAITTVKGKGTRKLAVFADPECPYCQQLEHELKEMDDVVIYTFLFPLESIHPGARARAEKIWCSADRAAVWSSWMLNKTAPGAEACADNPTATLLELGDKLRINSTPTLFFADGHRVSGLLDKEQLEKNLR